MATFKSLSKTEMKHLRSQEMTTLKQFKATADAHVRMRAENPQIEPCYECKNIARKLGVPV
jgi:hypothetical protein